ncbi:hypothetical protein PGTUg99_022571 [Puccinia graminis f. sp. tritici]|uniref:Uncharacterized protein n=1 Tax=Puccinia graminis f. sp. tritici TaxID=56615 RepID=A0A5B0NJH6_PUCGR|nr:hypothetical protein PGTUg99_022571 [Puccinia graminis f. sp. tritici]
MKPPTLPAADRGIGSGPPGDQTNQEKCVRNEGTFFILHPFTAIDTVEPVALTVDSVGISKHDVGIDICQAHAMHASSCSTRRIIATVDAHRNTKYRIILFKTLRADCP